MCTQPAPAKMSPPRPPPPAMTDTPEDPAAVAREIAAFPDRFRTLLLATASAAGEPLASYAPYLRDGRDFCVYLSELAAHTANLAARARASVLFIEDEAASPNLFARRRLTCQCAVAEVPRTAPEYDALLDRFAAHHGKLVGVLRGLADFHLYRLQPESAVFVSGFGRAYAVEGAALDEVRWLQR